VISAVPLEVIDVPQRLKLRLGTCSVRELETIQWRNETAKNVGMVNTERLIFAHRTIAGIADRISWFLEEPA
jgi:hypothetical protein